MSFLRDTVQAAGAGVALTAGRFIAMAVIARKLDVELFGTLAFSIFCLDLVVLAGLMGLPGVITRFLPITPASERAGFLRLRSFWALGSAALILIAAPLLSWFVIGFSGPVFWLFNAWALVSVGQILAVAEMQGRLRYDLVGWSGLLGAVLLVGGAFLLVSDGSLSSAIAVLIAAVAVQALPWLAARRAESPEDTGPTHGPLPDRRAILGYGANVWVTSLTTAVVWSRGELLVVEELLDARSLGLYGAAITLTALVWRLTGLLQGAVAPHLSKRLESGERLTEFIGDMNRLTIAVSAVCALGIALLGREVAGLVFGASFLEAGEIMAYMAPGAAIAGIGTVNLSVQYLSNAAFTRNALIVASVLLLVIAWVLTQSHGAAGSAGARSLTLVTLSAAMPVWLISRGYGQLGRTVLIEMLAIVALVTAASALSLTTDLTVALRAGAWALGAYVLLARATGTPDPRLMLGRTLEKLRAL